MKGSESAPYVKAIKAYRRENNMTAEQFAKDVCGYKSGSNVKKWEAGDPGTLKYDNICAIVEKLGITYDEFFTGMQSATHNINRCTGLPDKAIQSLKNRSIIETYFVNRVIGPLLTEPRLKKLSETLVTLIAKKRQALTPGPDDYNPDIETMMSGLRWSMVEELLKRIDDAVAHAVANTEKNETIEAMLSNEHNIQVFSDFGGILQKESEDKQE